MVDRQRYQRTLPDRRGIAYLVIILAITAFAGVARFAHIDFGLPDRLRPDEEFIINSAWGVLSGDLNPYFFDYPTFLIYLLAIVLRVLKQVDLVYGLCGLNWSLGLGDTEVRAFSHLMGRAVVATFGTLTIPIIARTARLIGGSARWGVIAAVIAATAFIHVRDSHFFTTDVPVTLFLSLALLYTVRFKRSGKDADLIGAVGSLALACSTKYNAVPLLLIPVVSIALRRSVEGGVQWRSLIPRRIVFVTAIPLIVVAVAAPFAYLNPHELFSTLGRLRALTQDVSVDWHEGLGRFWLLLFGLPMGFGTLGTGMFTAVGIFVLWKNLRGGDSDRRFVTMLMYCVLVMTPLVLSNKNFVRYTLPLLPVYSVFLTLGVVRLVDVASKAGARRAVIAVLVTGALTAGPTIRSFEFLRVLGVKDTRSEAREYLERHLPEGGVIGAFGRIGYLAYSKPQLDHTFSYKAIVPGEKLPEIVILDVGDPSEEQQRFLVDNYDSVGRYSARCSATGWSGRPRFEKPDAFYIPLSGISACERPGPEITIFRIKSAETLP